MKKLLHFSLALTILLTISCKNEIRVHDDDEGHFLYVLSNGTDTNSVLTFRRSDSDGTLTFFSMTYSGGKGTGLPLASQGPIAISNDRNWILAVNAASNSISAFKITDHGLELTSTVLSGGNKPVSITCYNNLVYVLNANDNGSIAGYKLSDSGLLTSLENSLMDLDTIPTNPAQISFLQDGKMLAITLKNTNKIIAFNLNDNGSPAQKFSLSSNSPRPYGFAVGNQGNIYVSEASLGAMSVYNVSSTGITSVAGPLPTNQIAACWAAATPDGKYAYILNAQSNTVTGYTINSMSSFTLMETSGITALAGIKPIDIKISDDSKFAYVLNFDDQSVRLYNITSDGSLEKIEDRFNLPLGSTGIAVK